MAKPASRNVISAILKPKPIPCPSTTITESTLSIIYTNCNGLLNKTVDLNTKSNKSDIICLVETKTAKEGIYEFNNYHNPHEAINCNGESRGGILIAVRTTLLEPILIDKSDDNSIMTVQINVSENFKFWITLCYAPQESCSEEEIINFYAFISKQSLLCSEQKWNI